MIFIYNTILSNNGLPAPVIFLQVAINANFLFCAIYDLIGLGPSVGAPLARSSEQNNDIISFYVPVVSPDQAATGGNVLNLHTAS